MLISFSGIDGSGKSTLIAELKDFLEKRGQRVIVLTVYDHLSCYALLRKIRDGLKAALGAKSKVDVQETVTAGIRNPHPGTTDKEGWFRKLMYGAVRNPAARTLAYGLDIFVVAAARFYHEGIFGNILITDRYLYDTLADIAYEKTKGWEGVKFLFALSPKADVSVWVDAPPEEAFRRKPEYPLEYIRWRREFYRECFELLKKKLVLKNEDLRQAIQTMNRELEKHIG